jgi:hypothetical protein
MRHSSPDESASVPSQRSAFAIRIQDFKEGLIVGRRQPNVVSMHRKHTPITPGRRHIDFVQASRSSAMNRFIATAKIIEM